MNGLPTPEELSKVLDLPELEIKYSDVEVVLSDPSALIQPIRLPAGGSVSAFLREALVQRIYADRQLFTARLLSPYRSRVQRMLLVLGWEPVAHNPTSAAQRFVNPAHPDVSFDLPLNATHTCAARVTRLIAEALAGRKVG